MKKIFLSAIVALATVEEASAQEFGYGRLNASIGQLNDIDTSSINGEVGFNFGEADVFLSGNRADFKLDGEEILVDRLTFGAGYTIANKYRVDISASEFGVNTDGDSVDFRLTEVGFAYDNGKFFARASYATLKPEDEGSIDDLLGLHVGYAINDELSFSVSTHAPSEPIAEIEDPVFIVSAKYDTEKFGVKLDYATATLEDELGDIDLSLLTLKANYQINNQWGLTARYSRADLGGRDVGPNVDIFGVGGTYNLNDRYTFYAGYRQLRTEGQKYDGLKAGVSIVFGSKPSSYQTTADRLGGAFESLTF